MNIYLISDTHFNHYNIKTYCQRPDDYNERLIRNWREIVKADDMIIHLGDVFMHKVAGWDVIWPQLTGKKTLIRGNHDRKKSAGWWIDHGFDSCVDSLILRRCWLTHEPADHLPPGCILNIHGHLHNIWHGFNQPGQFPAVKLRHPWQRLFSVEYTNYMPVEMDKFIAHPKKYLATGLGD